MSETPSLFAATVAAIEEMAVHLAEQIASLPLADRVDALNRARYALHQVSPFRDEPVDLVLWLEETAVEPNDYNPNFVHRPEMELLNTSIEVDHLTMPIPTHVPKRDVLALIARKITGIIVDGAHRRIVGTSNKKIAKRLHGYLPVTITHTYTDNDRKASTVRHNRARGVHKLDGMTDIVLSMLRNGWTDDEVAAAMGMDADEVLRMKQVSGIAKAFQRPNYNRAWINDDGQETLD
jgi:hypothetical protein